MNKIKKLLLLFPLLLFSFSSYAEWVDTALDANGDTHYVDFKNIKVENGYVYYWKMVNYEEPSDETLSIAIYHEGDCDNYRYRDMVVNTYTEHMAKGNIYKTLTLESDGDWTYAMVDTLGEYILGRVCKKKAELRQELLTYLAQHYKENTIVDYIDLGYAKYLWLGDIVAKVKSYWRYQGAEDDWVCTAFVQQDVDGTVEAVNIQNCNTGDSDKARSFKNSIERAVYKASPLPSLRYEGVFDREIQFEFRVN